MISSCLRIKYQHLYKFQEGLLWWCLSTSHLTLCNSVVTHCCSQNGVFFSVPLPCPALPCLLAFVKAVSFASVIASFCLFSGKLTSAPCMFVSKKHFLTFTSLAQVIMLSNSTHCLSYTGIYWAAVWLIIQLSDSLSCSKLCDTSLCPSASHLAGTQ